MAAFNFHRRKTRRWWYAGVTLVAAAVLSVFYVAGASANVLGSPSGFESADQPSANMVLDTDGNTDWNCFQGSGGFQASNYGPGPGVNTFDATNCGAHLGATDLTADSAAANAPLGLGAGEAEQTPGQKFDTACPTFKIGNNPPKDEWTNVAEYTEAANNGDLYFYGATIRPVVNGNTSGNVYFNQGTNPAGALCHTVGDILIAFDFLNGGGTPSLHSLEWINSPATATTPANTCFVSSDQGGLCWGDKKDINSAFFEGNVNTSAIAAADNSISHTLINPNAFAEFGINITAALNDAGITNVPCFANQSWVSRSSGSSFTSSPEDVEVVSRQTCGSITIIKHTLQGDGTTRGVDTSFTYTTSGTGLSGFSLNDKTGAPDVLCGSAPCNKKVFSGLHPGSYAVTEGAEPANFAFVSLTCTPTGNGTTAAQSSDPTKPTEADITLGIGGSATCIYTNQQQLAAINIVKDSSKGAGAPLGGAKFDICTNSNATSTNCTAPTFPSGFTNPTAATSGTDGSVCVGGLSLGTYYVVEVTTPSGYSNDTGLNANKTAAATSNGTCDGTPSVTVTFTDTPLSKITVTFGRFGTQTETNASIVCKAGNTVLSASPSEQGQGDSFAISSYTAASPTVITLPANSIDTTKNAVNTTIPVQITGVTGGTPSINGAFTATVKSASTISIPVNVTANTGTGGSVNVLDDTSELFGDGTTGLVPGTYTCTVIIDP